MIAINEHQLQASIMAQVDLQANQDPLWGLIYAVPNGGHRNKATAARLKAEGVRPGVPDLVWPIARHGYHGLYMELKVGRNTLAPEQATWAYLLQLQGYFHATVKDDPEEAINILQWYLEGDPT